MNMRQLMISLDKNILNKDSIVARRMVVYGKMDELFIVIPDIKKEIFDLSETVHVLSTGGNKLLQFCRLKKIGQRLIKEHGIGGVTAQDPFFTGLLGWWLKKKFDLELEIQVHGDFFGDYYRRQWWRSGLARFIINRADKIRVVGERIRQSLLSLGVTENKITVRPIQNDSELIKNLPIVINLRDKYCGYEKIFLVLGRLDPAKNICWLIDIFKEVVKKKNYLLLIVGRGSEESSIRKQMARNNLGNNVALQNWTEDPYSYLKKVDCVLFPSLSEGYGLVAMEAATVGTPVIMTDVGVANYELKPGPKIKIVPVGDKDAFVEEVLKI